MNEIELKYLEQSAVLRNIVSELNASKDALRNIKKFCEYLTTNRLFGYDNEMITIFNEIIRKCNDGLEWKGGSQ